jgi:hypothetical protein
MAAFANSKPMAIPAWTTWDITTRVSGEIIEEVGIYRFKSGLRDAFLERLWGLEESYRATSER